MSHHQTVLGESEKVQIKNYKKDLLITSFSHSCYSFDFMKPLVLSCKVIDLVQFGNMCLFESHGQILFAPIQVSDFHKDIPQL